MIHFDQHLGLSDLDAITTRTVRDLREHAHEFDSIAVQGVSGMIVGSPVALALGKPLVIVRKDSDMHRPCWHISVVENAENAGRRALFLDDYVGHGSTLSDVKGKLASVGTSVTGRYEYAHAQYNRPEREYAWR